MGGQAIDMLCAGGPRRRRGITAFHLEMIGSKSVVTINRLAPGRIVRVRAVPVAILRRTGVSDSLTAMEISS